MKKGQISLILMKNFVDTVNSHQVLTTEGIKDRERSRVS